MERQRIRAILLCTLAVLVALALASSNGFCGIPDFRTLLVRWQNQLSHLKQNPQSEWEESWDSVSQEEAEALTSGFQVWHRGEGLAAPHSSGTPLSNMGASSGAEGISRNREASPKGRRRQLQEESEEVGTGGHTRTEWAPPPDAVKAEEEEYDLDPTVEGNRTAICLVGGARAFEATGPSILHFLVKQLEPSADLFVNAPLDEDSAKLWIFTGARHVAAIRVFPTLELPEVNYPPIITGFGSPKGRQGLLQYFRLVQGCVRLVQRHEARTGVKYAWIIRGRLDAFWSAPMPPLYTFQREAYTIPYGSDWGGYNDRFGVGERDPSRTALRRLSLLHSIKRLTNFTWLNSEGAYKLQFQVNKVPVVRAHIPFCVLTRRFSADLITSESSCNPFFFSLLSWLPLNGAKCMPCAPCTSLNIDPAQKGLVFCNLSVEPWMQGQWQQRFDAAVGPFFASQRKTMLSLSLYECIRRFRQLKSKSASWESPRPEALCFRHLAGPVSEVGAFGVFKAGSFPTLLSLLNKSSVVVAPVIKESPDRDSSWDEDIKAKVPGVKIQKPKISADELQHLGVETIKGWGFHVLDVLKLNVEGSDASALLSWLKNAPAGKDPEAEGPLGVLPICQLLVGFPNDIDSLGIVGRKGHQAVIDEVSGGLEAAFGFQLDSCIRGGVTLTHRCLFFSTEHCRTYLSRSSSTNTAIH